MIDLVESDPESVFFDVSRTVEMVPVQDRRQTGTVGQEGRDGPEGAGRLVFHPAIVFDIDMAVVSFLVFSSQDIAGGKMTHIAWVNDLRIHAPWFDDALEQFAVDGSGKRDHRHLAKLRLHAEALPGDIDVDLQQRLTHLSR